MLDLPHPPARGLSIRLLAPLILAVPVVAVSLVLGGLAVAQSRREAEDLATQIVDQIDARVLQRISALAETADRVSRHNAYLISIGVYDPDRLRDWLPTMQRQLTIFDALSGICWGDRDGHAVWLVEYPDEPGDEFGVKDALTGSQIHLYEVSPEGALQEEPGRRLEYDPRTRPWYHAGANAANDGRSAGWTAPYGWMRGDNTGVTLGISYARPIADERGELRGVIDTELELHSLSQFLSALRIAETGFAFVIDRSGGFIAAGVGEEVVTPEGEQGRATESGDELVRAAAHFAVANLGADAAGRARVRTLTDAGGRRAWVSASPVTTTGLDWIAVVVIPESDMLSRVQAAGSRALLAGSVAVLATLLAGIGVAWAAVRPILRLRDHVRKVGEGDLQRELHLAWARELTDLSRDINAMTRGLLDRARLQESLRLAMDVQQALLPEGPPHVAHLDVAGFSKYCDETGGDYYDFLTITEAGDSKVGIALGDVMGHGVAAALLMASARALLRSRAGESPGPLSDHLAHVNTQLARDTGGIRFMTMLLMTADGARGRVEWSTAGQHSGLLYDAATGEFEELQGSGLPLGIVGDATYDDYAREGIAPGSVLLLTTDGLFEAHNPEKEQYGWDRIRESLRTRRHLPAAEIAPAIHADLLAFCRETPPEDDVTFIVVKFLG